MRIQLYRMKYRDIVRLVRQDGWYLKRTSGSHEIYKHPTKPGIVVTAAHGDGHTGRNSEEYS